MVIEISLKIYKKHVVIFCEKTLKQIIAYGIKRGIGKENFDEDWVKGIQEMTDGGCTGFCTHYGRDNNDILIWVRKTPKTRTEYGVLYHELYHAVDYLAKDICFDTMTDKNGMSEARAYMYEFLINEANYILWNKPKKRKKK